jgi:hypothetical protein
MRVQTDSCMTWICWQSAAFQLLAHHINESQLTQATCKCIMAWFCHPRSSSFHPFQEAYRIVTGQNSRLLALHRRNSTPKCYTSFHWCPSLMVSLFFLGMIGLTIFCSPTSLSEDYNWLRDTLHGLTSTEMKHIVRSKHVSGLQSTEQSVVWTIKTDRLGEETPLCGGPWLIDVHNPLFHDHWFIPCTYSINS